MMNQKKKQACKIYNAQNMDRSFLEHFRNCSDSRPDSRNEKIFDNDTAIFSDGFVQNFLYSN